MVGIWISNQFSVQPCLPRKKFQKHPRNKNRIPILIAKISPHHLPFLLKSSSFKSKYEDFSSSLDEASRKFPSFISSSAFIGSIVDDADSNSRGCKIWLSESAMISSSISPASVSLASLDRVLGGFPLSVLSDEFARHFGFDLGEDVAAEAGNFFAMTTVFPSCKVLNNGVRLSSSLLFTLGCPAASRTIFVYPVKCKRLSTSKNCKPYGLAASCFSYDDCKELYLSVVSLKGKFNLQSAISSRLDLSKKVANGLLENSKILSPKTPCVSESHVSPLCSAPSHTSNYDKSASKTTYLSHESIDGLDVKEFLGGDCSRKLLETCASSWLCSRNLFSGNFVTVPVLSGQCIFRVVGSERLPRTGQNWNGKDDDFATRDPDFKKDKECAFSADLEKKIRLLLPGNPMVETSGTSSLAHPEL